MTLHGISAKTIVEACFDLDGVAQLATVYDVARAVGVEDQPVRIAIRRMQTAGVLTQVGRGRKGHLVLSAGARARDLADQAYLTLAAAQDAGEQTWGGSWHLYTFSVPEQLRQHRDAIRSALVRLGAAPLAQGLYVSPFPLRSALDVESAEQYLIVAEAQTLTGPGLGSPKEIAETLWPAAAIEGAYAPLGELLAGWRTAAATDDVPERLAASLRLAEAFSFAMERDPLVPPELREASWSPPETRREFWRAWDALQRDLPAVTLFESFREPGRA